MKWIFQVLVIVFVEVGIVSPVVIMRGVVVTLEESKADRVFGIDLPALAQAVETFRARYRRLPHCLDELVAAGIVDKVPTDPWDWPFIYEQGNGVAHIASLGGDRRPGGDGQNADFECWISDSTRCSGPRSR